jgi:hypothetical protein
MGWILKFTRRRVERKGDAETRPKRSHARGPSRLKSCLEIKEASPVAADSQRSFFSSSASVRSGESGLIDRRTSVNESQRTRSTDFSSSSRSSMQSRARKNVRFHEVQIREYQRTVGDHPSVSTGPPVG